MDKRTVKDREDSEEEYSVRNTENVPRGTIQAVDKVKYPRVGQASCLF